MTTHYQKIQALGNRMAENLTIMGVPSQFDEGGLTLADKILEISGRVTSGIILYADKKIAQSEDTVNLYALVLDDNTAVSGETVRFYADTILRTATINNNGDWIGDDYWVSTSSSDTCWIGGGQGFIQFNSTTIKIFTSSWSPEYSYTGKFHIKDGVLTYTDTNDETQTIDVSGLNLTKAYGATDPFTVYYTWVNVTTGSNGVATYAYTCTGSGLREFYATSGTFVSETVEVIDGFYYDTVSSDTNQNYYVNTATGTSIAYSNGYLVLTLGTGSKYTRLKDTKYTLADLKGETIHFSSYIKTSSGTAKVIYYDDRSGNLVARENGNTVSEDTSSLTVTIPSNVTAVAFQIEPVSMSTGDTISFKDFLLYITTSS